MGSGLRHDITDVIIRQGIASGLCHISAVAPRVSIGRLWAQVHWEIGIGWPIFGSDDPFLSFGVVVQTKLLYEEAYCKPCNTIHMLFILTFTEHPLWPSKSPVWIHFSCGMNPTLCTFHVTSVMEHFLRYFPLIWRGTGRPFPSQSREIWDGRIVRNTHSSQAPRPPHPGPCNSYAGQQQRNGLRATFLPEDILAG